MRHFHPPIHTAVVAVALVAGLASYQGVDKLVLAKGGATYGTTSEPGHDSSSTSTTTPKAHHETSSTTSTTTHKDTPPPSTSSTSSTVPHEPGTTTSTTTHHETGSTTSTTTHTETPRPTTPPSTTPPTTTPPTAPPAGVAQLSFGCMSGFTGDQGWAKCGWSKSKASNFDHYLLTREVPGSSHVVIFQTSDVASTYYVDGPLQGGAQYTYWVGAFDSAGHLIGQGGGPIHLVCCPGGVATP